MGDTYHSDISGRASPIPRLFREGLRQSLGYFGKGCANPSVISGRASPIPRLFREGLRQSLGYFALSGLEMEPLVSDF
jgi:hypothetical protein